MGGQALCWGFIIQNIAIGFWIIYKYQIRAGPLAEENWYLFAYLVEKPWVKTGSLAIGVMFADLYMQLLAYRALPTDEARKEKFPKMHGFVTTAWIKNLSMLMCVAAIIFSLTCGHQAIAKPYSWTMLKNACYYTFVHTIYSFANIIALFLIFCGGFPMARAFLARPFFVGLGKLTFVTALITPIMVQLIYSQLPEGLFVYFIGVQELGIGNVICVMMAGLALYLLFEFPMRRLLQWSVLPAISSDKRKHSYFVDLIARLKGLANDASLDFEPGNKSTFSSPPQFQGNVNATLYTNTTIRDSSMQDSREELSPIKVK